MSPLAARALLAISVAGCLEPPGPDPIVDEIDDTFTSKADAFGATEGSPEALGVLRVANELTRDQLRSRVGLSWAAAFAIDEARIGPDAQPGTADDVVITSLIALDAIPYIGANSFYAMLAEAERRGFISPTPPNSLDPFAVNPCPGPAIDGATEDRPSGSLGFYMFSVRERACTSAGCGAWTPVPLSQIAGAPTMFSGEVILDPYDDLRLRPQSCGSRLCQLSAQGATCERYGDCDRHADLYPGANQGRPAGGLTLVGKLTESCVTIRGATYWIDTTNVRHERQAAFVLPQ